MTSSLKQMSERRKVAKVGADAIKGSLVGRYSACPRRDELVAVVFLDRASGGAGKVCRIIVS
ncbi:MAG: hypothetical protein ACRD2X_01825 [Vicinamibacteraceae bacterium]